MRHTFVFRGTVEHNPQSAPTDTHFIKRNGDPAAIRRPKTDGVVFGFMEAPEGVVITQVDDITLDKRVCIDSKRHLAGGALGPNGKNVDEQSARRALEDVLRANGDLAEALGPQMAKLRS